MSPIPVSQALSDLHSRIRPVPRAYILRQDPLFAGSNSHPHWHRAIRPRSRTTQSILYAKSVSSAPAISNSLSIAEPLAPRTHQSHKFSHHHPHLERNLHPGAQMDQKCWVGSGGFGMKKTKHFQYFQDFVTTGQGKIKNKGFFQK